MIDNKTFNQVAQVSHVLGGAMFILLPAYLFGLRVNAACSVGVFGVLCAAFKEFWYDAKYESAEVRGNSAEDFVFYCLGLLLACLAVAVVN